MERNILSELRSTEEGRLLHDFMCEKFPNGMDWFDFAPIFLNNERFPELKKKGDSFYLEFEAWKQNKKQ